MADNAEEQSQSLQDLFATLRANPTKSASATITKEDNVASNQQAYTFPFMKSSDQNRYSGSPQVESQSSSFLQSFNGYQQRPSGITSPTSTTSKTLHSSPAEHSAVDRTANLLSLLKFNQSSSSQNNAMQNTQGSSGPPDQNSFQPPPGPSTQHTHGRGLSTSDLVANFMGRSSSSLSHETLTSSAGASKHPAPTVTPSAANPQDYLLQLLNRPKQMGSNTPTPLVRSQTQPQAPDLSENQQTKSSADLLSRVAPVASRQNKNDLPVTVKPRTESPLRTFGTSDIKETTPFEPENMPKVQAPSQTIFTYVNPFEQLAASSPRNAKSRSGTTTPQKGLHKVRQEIHVEGAKRKSDGQSPARASSTSRRKLTPLSDRVLESIESPTSTHPDNERSRVNALMGIGAPTSDPETVAEALNEVGAHVSRQVDDALTQAGNVDSTVQMKDDKEENQQEITEATIEEGLQDAVTIIKEEYGKDEDINILEEIQPEEVATAMKGVVEEAMEDDIGRTGSNAEDTNDVDQASNSPAIAVYNFPMKPFVSIDIKQDKSCPQELREDAIMDIARLKKEFDQMDRTLTTASSSFILYAMPKTGGLRIIRQEDGSDRQMYKETHDRIFNVAISTAAPSSLLRDVQTFIATAVSGNVYWARICQSGEDIIQENAKVTGLVFPPVPAYDEHTSGGQLKTRAKRSSRHPEFFGIGRGKSIQIVFPAHARDTCFPSWAPPDSTVDTNTYFKERCLKISTGKAGKDFTFSEDDTVITTLDKAGRLRFWDIRDLVDEANGTASKIAPIEIKTPVLSFSTASSTEKSWPTSVLFVDKVRPYVKCTALRYLIVGMKQNHTLQLWDLGLGKAVQELGFPHQKESDAICSVCYHPGSGIIVVGHPTRNSIYFIHLSAPKYNLPVMSQARFVQRLAGKDTSLPQPESTAIMSGLREYSFSSKGQLRSIDLLPVASDPTKSAQGEEDAPLFELYVMHSKGVTCLSIRKEDLGWSKDSKVINPLDAEEQGLIEVRDLRETQSNALSERSSVNGDAMPGIAGQTKGSLKQSPKTPSKTASAARLVKELNEAPPSESSALADPLTNGKLGTGPEKAESKRKKRIPATSTISSPTPASNTASGQRSSAAGNQGANKSVKETKKTTSTRVDLVDVPEAVPVTDEEQERGSSAGADMMLSGMSGDTLERELKKLEKVVSNEFQNVLSRELGTLYRRFDEDKRVQDAAGAAKQDAILRLVSSTLTDNVEKSLVRIINTSVQQFVVPSISDVTGSTLQESIPTILGHQLLHTMPTQLKLALPEAVSAAIQNPDVLRALSDQVTAKIATHVERQFSAVLQQTIVPAFQNLAIGAAQKMNAETERRVAEQLQQVAVQRHEDTLKIDQLTALTRALTETVHAMAAAQSGFQQEFLTLQQQALQERRELSSKTLAKSSIEKALAPIGSVEATISPEKKELHDIINAMQEGNYEQATIQWIQSKRADQIFDSFFRECNPMFLQECDQLVALSVATSLTNDFTNYPRERIDWLEEVLQLIDPRHPDISGVGAEVGSVLAGRLETEYMRRAEKNRHDALLGRIAPLVKTLRAFSKAAEQAKKQAEQGGDED